MALASGCYDSSQGLRVGFIEQRDFWDFKLSGPFSVYNERGEIILRNIPPTYRWRIQLENWQSAKFKYQILIDRFIDKNAAMEAEYRLIEKGIGTTLRQVGGKHIHNGKTVQSTTEYWLVIDDMKSEEEALDFAKKRLSGISYQIIKQKISEPHGKFNLLNQAYEKIGESENLIRLVPDDPETNVYLYHVTRENEKNAKSDRYAKVKGPVEFRCLQSELIGAIANFSIEDYVENVLALKYIEGMPAEALKAVSVVIRSKALSQFCVKHEDEPYDICNKSHCHVFEGYRETPELVKNAVKVTNGEVLFRKKRVVFAEMTEVCGGFTESMSEFETVRVEFDYPGIYDCEKRHIPQKFSELDREESAKNWIKNPDQVFCDLSAYSEPKIVSRFYPDFRWQRFWAMDDLVELVEKKSGQTIGTIFEIAVTKRSSTGRVLEMEILGADRNLILRGEEEIRSIFGGTDELPGTCFYIESQLDMDGFPESFSIRGAGSGSGFGICIAGAIGMAEQGFNYHDILSHYFRGTTLKKIYGD